MVSVLKSVFRKENPSRRRSKTNKLSTHPTDTTSKKGRPSWQVGRSRQSRNHGPPLLPEKEQGVYYANSPDDCFEKLAEWRSTFSRWEHPSDTDPHSSYYFLKEHLLL
jgi:hypothetical protein